MYWSHSDVWYKCSKQGCPTIYKQVYSSIWIHFTSHHDTTHMQASTVMNTDICHRMVMVVLYHQPTISSPCQPPQVCYNCHSDCSHLAPGLTVQLHGLCNQMVIQHTHTAKIIQNCFNTESVSVSIQPHIITCSILILLQSQWTVMIPVL